MKDLTNTYFVISMLKDNKSRFTKKQFQALMTIAKHPFDYRKSIEAADSRIYYVPSIRQIVEPKLACIGLEIVSTPANDGSKRKLYAIRPLKKEGFS